MLGRRQIEEHERHARAPGIRDTLHVMPASPYRIAAKRPSWVDPIARPVAPARARESGADIEAIASACEYDTPPEPEQVSIRGVLVGIAIGTGLAVIGGALVALARASVGL